MPQKLRALVLGIIPPQLHETAVTLRENLLDSWRYLRAAASTETLADKYVRATRHEARVTMAYHRVEKGLALPNPRRPFGHTLEPILQELLDYPAAAGWDPASYVSLGSDALAALKHWNNSGEIDSRVSPLLTGESNQVSLRELSAFFSTRHSVRNFDTARVPKPEEILAAVEIARNTPSVCNRQAFRVHVFQDRDTIGDLLEIQNGAAGFAETVPALGVVTVRRALFVGPFERNQRWVDGGLFAMTLVWALHAVGLSTCMLNWSMPISASDRLRKRGGIPAEEDIVVLIAIGHAAPGARVARSEKRTTDDLARFHSWRTPFTHPRD